ncbi:sensor histidine kinase [Hoylesella nanceiensis]|uniref:histidine kinase n=1 Tax=Hoylesella nanceiensis TaxID=425941 RepID=A0ABS6YEL1_9BACT|nr:HAMP domain-containing sensor histidine kinase [Hoylesella nanceiensis]MBW4770018.1 HAMP domain-containing histidine kinase [Hoylesella nanceiensis]
MKWTRRTHYIKIMFFVIAIVIAIGSLWVSHTITEALSQEERNKMEVWAEAIHSLNTADENTDLALVLKVVNGNNTIPVVVIDAKDSVQAIRNINFTATKSADVNSQALALAHQLKRKGRAIKLQMSDNPHDFIEVCYDDSLLIKRLTIYPYIQLTVVVLFITLALLALLWSKKAEQNRLWVGLSKETAHQLGTPISSLMAWNEILKEQYPDDPFITDMGEDVKRLQLIADRFSKIGSQPTFEPCNMNDIVLKVSAYIGKRASSGIAIETKLSAEPAVARINMLLIEWVIENLCKNAIDAIGNKGAITIEVMNMKHGVVVDVSDTGKGIRKADIANVFRPGFTTKKRGWGLGLSLAKRIIEQYHKGHIFVKQSEQGVGTTFRIELLS